MPPADAFAQRLRRSRLLRGSARLGLVARGVLYLVLAYLAAALAGGWGLHGKQVNGNGALRAVAATPWGLLLLVLAAVGFTGFGVARFAAAYGDRSPGRLRRASTVGQGAFYLVMAALTLSFVLGRRSTGSEQQQQSTTERLLAYPWGRVTLAAAGAVVITVCAWQVWLACRGGFADSLRTRDMGRRARGLVAWVARVGIVARAAAVAPVGALLGWAAVRPGPRRAKGLDQLLMTLDRQPAGRALVWLVAAGFLVFAAYSFVEAHYREVHAGD